VVREAGGVGSNFSLLSAPLPWRKPSVGKGRRRKNRPFRRAGDCGGSDRWGKPAHLDSRVEGGGGEGGVCVGGHEMKRARTWGL